MSIDLLSRLSTTAAYCYDVSLIQKQQGAHEDLLCVLFSPELEEGAVQEDAVPQEVIFFQLFDLQKRQLQKTLIYNCYGPPFDPTRCAFVRYDATQKCWVIALQQGDWSIGMRTATEESAGNITLSPFWLLDRDTSDRGFHLLLDLDRINDGYRLFSHKAVPSHLSAPVIVQTEVLLQRPARNTLEERAVVTQQEAASQGITMTHWQYWREAIRQRSEPVKDHHHLLDKILLPEHVLFDPGTITTIQIPEVVIAKQTEIAAAEHALTIADQQTRLLVLCSPETWVRPHEHPRGETAIEQTGEQWRLWLTGWKRTEFAYKWTYEPDMGLPTDPSQLAHDYPVWPDVEVAAIVGPATSNHQPTFVATMAMQGNETLFSHGVCLTHDGQVVQVCNTVLGRNPSLCLCEQVVVGVDRLASSWHLWNWFVLDEAHLHIELRLDATCQRAVVCAQPEAARFWLIEETAEGVQVSLRDKQTLNEVEPAELLPGAKFLEGSGRPLESQPHRGFLPYNKALLLVLTDKQEELRLYQVR